MASYNELQFDWEILFQDYKEMRHGSKVGKYNNLLLLLAITNLHVVDNGAESERSLEATKKQLSDITFSQHLV